MADLPITHGEFPVHYVSHVSLPKGSQRRQDTSKLGRLNLLDVRQLGLEATWVAPWRHGMVDGEASK